MATRLVLKRRDFKQSLLHKESSSEKNKESDTDIFLWIEGGFSTTKKDVTNVRLNQILERKRLKQVDAGPRDKEICKYGR